MNKRHYENNILGVWLNAISQMCHGVIGFSIADISMSGKVGWYANIKKNAWFQFVQLIVDFTFFPIDGQDHCYQALVADKEEKYDKFNHIWNQFVISVLSIAGCLVLAPFFWLYFGISRLWKI